MTRPSRGERWSATTTRQIGFFLLPTRVSRTRTDIEAESLAAGHQLAQVGHLARGQLLHDLLHLLELLDQLIDGLDRRARAVRDPSPARAVQHLRVRALVRGHRGDDRLDAIELAVVHL